jgi:HK97 family phage major capsid protein
MKHYSPFKVLSAVFVVGLLALIALPVIVPAIHFVSSHPLAGSLPLAFLPMLGIVGGGTMDSGEFQERVLRGVSDVQARVESYEHEIVRLKEHINRLSGENTARQKARIAGMGGHVDARLFDSRGRRKALSDEAAAEFFATLVIKCQREQKLEAWIDDSAVRQRVLDQAREITGLSQRALSTTEIPLPSAWGSEVSELIAQYGIVRPEMTYYPMSSGIDKPARMGTRPAFGSIAMSAAFAEKKPTIDFATLENHKIGGIVIVPREINDQSAVQMGKFLSMYGAKEFAKAEDTWGFLADGSGTYETVKGICQIAKDNSKVVQLVTTKTHASDATLADFRSMRGLVSTGALSGAKYYLNHTWEQQLRTFKTTQDQDIFTTLPDGTSRLDGYPVVWVEPLQVYGTSATVNAYLAVFGNLQYWFFGERGSPRIDTSEHVYFANDQMAVRFIEEIDFDYVSLQAASALQTAAS